MTGPQGKDRPLELWRQPHYRLQQLIDTGRGNR